MIILHYFLIQRAATFIFVIGALLSIAKAQIDYPSVLNFMRNL